MAIPTTDTTETTEFEPRDTLNEVLKNLHGSLKWFWQLVMGLSMARAVDTLIDAYIRGTIEDRSPPAIAVLSFVLVFIPTFLRFYFGDSRYLDEHYIEYRKWRPIEEFLNETQRKVSLLRVGLDVILLFVIGILFIFLARALVLPGWFFPAWWILLIFNIIWLQLTMMLNREFSRETRIAKQPRYWAPKKWVWNNSAHALFFIPALWWWNSSDALHLFVSPFRFGISLQEALLLMICSTNSIVDILLTSDFYVPRLDREFHGVLVEEPEGSKAAPIAA